MIWASWTLLLATLTDCKNWRWIPLKMTKTPETRYFMRWQLTFAYYVQLLPRSKLIPSTFGTNLNSLSAQYNLFKWMKVNTSSHRRWCHCTVDDFTCFAVSSWLHDNDVSQYIEFCGFFYFIFSKKKSKKIQSQNLIMTATMMLAIVPEHHL